MKSIDSLGFLEVFGFTAGVEAADAMMKSAQVRLVSQHELNPGLVTLVVEGDLASCRAAVNAGKAAAARVGMVVGSHVIGRPDKDTESMILQYLPESTKEKILGKSTKPQKLAPVAPKTEAPVKAVVPVIQAEPAKVVQATIPKKTVVVPKKEATVEAKKEVVKKEAVIESKKENSVQDIKPVAPSLAVEKKPAPVVAPTAKNLMTQTEFERVIAYITAVAKGRSWKEIKIHFPYDPEQMLKKLNEAVTSGRIAKAGANYRKVENKRS